MKRTTPKHKKCFSFLLRLSGSSDDHANGFSLPILEMGRSAGPMIMLIFKAKIVLQDVAKRYRKPEHP